MNNNQKKRIVYISLFLVSVTALFLYLNTLRFRTVTIITKPENVNVTIDSENVYTSPVEIKLPKGVHTLTLNLDNYKQETYEFNVEDDLLLEYTLSREALSPARIIDTPTLVGSNASFHNNSVFAIDRSNQTLLKITENGTTTYVDERIAYYKHSNNYLFYITQDNPNELIVQNIKSNRKNIFNIENEAPISSIDIDDIEQNMYFLGNYDVNNRKSTLYQTSLANYQPKEVALIVATEVNFVNPDTLIIFSKRDAIDSSNIHFFKFSENSYVESLNNTVNTYHISPNKKNIVLRKSNEYSVINLQNLQKSDSHEISSLSLLSWLNDNNVIIATKIDNELTLTTINVTTFEPIGTPVTTTIESNKALKKIVGSLNDKLYIIDTDDNLFSVPFLQ